MKAELSDKKKKKKANTKFNGKNVPSGEVQTSSNE